MAKDMKKFTIQLNIYLCNDNKNLKQFRVSKVEQIDPKEIISATSSHGFAKASIMSEHQNLPKSFY